MEYHVEQTRPIHTTTVALQAAREALKSLPAQRQFVGLTDKERQELRDIHFSGEEMLIAAEAKLKEKNNG